MSTADAVDREVAWLTTSINDGLPNLLTANGGPWGSIQAYQPRTPGRRNTYAIVLRRSIDDKRFAAPRRMSTYEFAIKLYWPLTSGSGRAEDDQRAFDVGIDKLLARIDGQLGDKTHGGRFRSVAENPAYVRVHFEDPEQTMKADAEFRAVVTYMADDFEITG